VEVFFAHPRSPCQRRINENTNRFIRCYLPTGTPITSHNELLHQDPLKPPLETRSPTSTPSPTNRATAPEPPSTTAPPPKHSTNPSLPPI